MARTRLASLCPADPPRQLSVSPLKTLRWLAKRPVFPYLLEVIAFLPVTFYLTEILAFRLRLRVNYSMAHLGCCRVGNGFFLDGKSQQDAIFAIIGIYIPVS